MIVLEIKWNLKIYLINLKEVMVEKEERRIVKIWFKYKRDYKINLNIVIVC